jgi:hypothetical protein
MGSVIATIAGERKLISLIWFSSLHPIEQGNDRKKAQIVLKTTLEDHLGSNIKYLKFFFDAYQCQTYIQHRKNERIVLVFADVIENEIKTLIRNLHDLAQFHSAYVLKTVDYADENRESFSSFFKVSKLTFR